MKRKVYCLLLALSMLSLLFAPLVHANDDITVFVNGNKLEFDVPPMIVDGRTLVPFRAILEALGAEVEYDAEYQAIYGATLGKRLTMLIGYNVVNINSCIINIEIPPQIVNDRTLVPLRVVSECLGADVSWDAYNRRIDIVASDDQFIDWNDNFFYYGDVADDGITAEGYGTLYKIKDDRIRCTGYFENDILLEGKFYGYVDESTYYIGTFSSKNFGDREGNGTMYYSDGSFMESTWVEDKMNGNFTYYDFPNKMTLLGYAVNDKWHGEVTAIYEDGTTQIMLYENGERISNNTASVQTIPAIEETPQTVPSVGGNSDIPYAFVTANYPLYLYSNDGRTFLGKLTTNKYDNESISYKYGDYGSKYSNTSIFYQYGDYGSKYSSESAFNSYASEPPIIVDSDGDFIAYLTENKYKTPGVTYVKLLRILEKYGQ